MIDRTLTMSSGLPSPEQRRPIQRIVVADFLKVTFAILSGIALGILTGIVGTLLTVTLVELTLFGILYYTQSREYSSLYIIAYLAVWFPPIVAFIGRMAIWILEDWPVHWAYEFSHFLR